MKIYLLADGDCESPMDATPFSSIEKLAAYANEVCFDGRGAKAPKSFTVANLKKKEYYEDTFYGEFDIEYTIKVYQSELDPTP